MSNYLRKNEWNVDVRATFRRVLFGEFLAAFVDLFVFLLFICLQVCFTVNEFMENDQYHSEYTMVGKMRPVKHAQS